MKIAEVRKRAFAMPLTNPSFPPAPYRFYDREYVIITYRTDAAALEAVVPEPLEIVEPVVKYEFIRVVICFNAITTGSNDMKLFLNSLRANSLMMLSALALFSAAVRACMRFMMRA